MESSGDEEVCGERLLQAESESEGLGREGLSMAMPGMDTLILNLPPAPEPDLQARTRTLDPSPFFQVKVVESSGDEEVWGCESRGSERGGLGIES